MSAPGFRRRVLIEPGPGRVAVEFEDDWHRMAVTLHHDGAVARAVDSEMKRAPWTTCPGAMARLRETFTGERLAALARRGEKTTNCTHLYDLALLAAAHAGEGQATTYEVEVSDPIDGRREASVRRNGETALCWAMAGDRLVSPPELAGRRLFDLGDWIAGLDAAGQEAARLLRWTNIMAFGRQMEIPAGMSGERFGNGSCFTFQPERAEQTRRVADADRDLSAAGAAPLADREAAFAAVRRHQPPSPHHDARAATDASHP